MQYDRNGYFNEVVDLKEIDFLSNRLRNFKMTRDYSIYRITRADLGAFDYIAVKEYGTGKEKLGNILLYINKIEDAFDEKLIGKDIILPDIYDLYDVYNEYYRVT